MVGTISFKKFSGDNVDFIEYVKNYIAEHNDIKVEILIGTDSQNKGNHTTYSTVIVFVPTVVLLNPVTFISSSSKLIVSVLPSS